MKDFEPIDHPSDIGIIAYGKTKEALFANAARGMFALLAEAKEMPPSISMEITVRGEALENLLINWLNELLFLEDSKHLIFQEFKIKEMSSTSLTATVSGDLAQKYSLLRSIKAATYNQLEVAQGQKGWHVKVIFDV